MPCLAGHQITNLNTKNISGFFSINKFNFFYKVLSLHDYQRELQGYHIIRQYYPVAKLLFQNKNTASGILIYEYEKSIGVNRGLLLDLFTQDDRTWRKKQQHILKMYEQIFIKTIKKTYANSSRIFFEDRIDTRLKSWYGNKFINQYDGQRINFNGQSTILNIREIITRTEMHFNLPKKRWSVISQCDPGDLNIGLKPIILDYLGGGYNPLMAEFAIFLWYNLAQSNYFSPIYNKSTFTGHPLIFLGLDKVRLTVTTLQHHIDYKRKAFIFNYIDTILTPLLKMSKYDLWYEDFKNYLAMRILCVFNIAKMKRVDALLSLAYLSIFYNRPSIQKLSDLKKTIDLLHPQSSVIKHKNILS